MTEHGTGLRSAARPGLLAIFTAFFRLGVTSFGGNTAVWVYDQIVQRRHWVSDAEFLSAVALGRIVPGSGGVNLTVQIGQRLAGAAGAAAAVLALLMGPLVIVVGLAMVYARIGRNPVLEGTLDGVAAAAIGLTFATGLRLVVWRPANIGPLAVTLVTVLCVGVLRWLMVPVVLCLVPVSVGLALVQRPGHGHRGNA
jgi:chromate transporter